MSHDFQVGDGVIKVGRSRFNGKGPSPIPKGSIHRVIAVNREPHWPYHAIIPNGHDCWIYADCWRKIQPCEPEFVELLKRCKPKVDA